MAGVLSWLDCCSSKGERNFTIKSRSNRGQNVWAITRLDLMRRAKVGRWENNTELVTTLGLYEEGYVTQKIMINFWKEKAWPEADEKDDLTDVFLVNVLQSQIFLLWQLLGTVCPVNCVLKYSSGCIQMYRLWKYRCQGCGRVSQMNCSSGEIL